jgi:putative spermidine/putrescine transport system permease protein
MYLDPTASWSERAWYAFLWLFCGVVFFFLLVPLLVVLPLSFNSSFFFSYPLTGFSLRWYQEYISKESWQIATKNSLVIATCTMLLATTLGTMASLGLHRATFKWKWVIEGALIAPLIVPVIIIAIASYFFFATIGLLNTLSGLIVAHTVLASPFVVIIVSATLAGFDINQARAAASLGASPIRVFFTVIVPAILPGLVTAAVFAFVTSFDEVVIVNFIAGPEQYTMTKEMWKGTREELRPTVLAVAAIMVLVSIFVLTAIEMLRRRGEKLQKSSP